MGGVGVGPGPGSAVVGVVSGVGGVGRNGFCVVDVGGGDVVVGVGGLNVGVGAVVVVSGGVVVVVVLVVLGGYCRTEVLGTHVYAGSGTNPGGTIWVPGAGSGGVGAG
ncbi:hypothetical protein [Mycolicibacterium mengxianglii]|uniref:hypothetical protein n=1 Tax=Mycolicibacterium mengxianglii TaxID=2736649 RepID=UPI0018EF1D61|nr:hypothetical protein [Mycolicibacterium mengxianglii]